jgi:glutathione S-transferase
MTVVDWSRWSIKIRTASVPRHRAMPKGLAVAGHVTSPNSQGTLTPNPEGKIAMSEFIVHSIPGSPFGRAVLATLEEKGASYRLARVAPGTLHSPEHLARQPFARVPVLEHDGFSLYESQAILRYLDRVLPTPALTPADPRAAARMDQVMNINDWYLFQGVGNVIAFQRVVGPRLLGLVPDEAAIDAAMPKAHTVFKELARLLGDQNYFAGDSISLADLLIEPELDFLAQAPEWAVLTGPHPNLVAWLARMEARPSLRATTWERVIAMARAA